MRGRRCVGNPFQHHLLRCAQVVHKCPVEATCQGRFWLKIEGRIPAVSDGDTTTVAIDIATGSVNLRMTTRAIHSSGAQLSTSLFSRRHVLLYSEQPPPRLHPLQSGEARACQMPARLAVFHVRQVGRAGERGGVATGERSAPGPGGRAVGSSPVCGPGTDPTATSVNCE